MKLRLYSWAGWAITIVDPDDAPSTGDKWDTRRLVIEYEALEPGVGFKAVLPFGDHDEKWMRACMIGLEEGASDET